MIMPKQKLPVTVTAPVLHGRGLGHSLGAPTVNQLLPDHARDLCYGVYFSRCTIGGRTYASVTNVGVKPTVSQSGEPIAETHILDCDADLYGMEACTELLLFRREEKKFSSETELARAIAEDIAAAKEYFKSKTV